MMESEGGFCEYFSQVLQIASDPRGPIVSAVNYWKAIIRTLFTLYNYICLMRLIYVHCTVCTQIKKEQFIYTTYNYKLHENLTHTNENYFLILSFNLKNVNI